LNGGEVSKRQKSRLIRIAIYIVTVIFLALVGRAIDWPVLREALFNWDIAKEQFPRVITMAARNTLIFTAIGFTGSLVLGLVLALMRLSTIRPYRWFASIYIETFRGLPALLTIFLIGLGVPVATGLRIPGVYTAGSLALAIVYGAYMAETIRAGIEAVPRGQMEAARSLGMTYGTAMRTIIIPQAFRIVIPPMTNEFIALLKDTSLISVLGVTDLTRELTRFGRDGVIHLFNATPLVVAGLVYLAMTVPMTRGVAQLEKRAARAR
jgi:polar amino acid transport system permease protein